MQHPMRIGIENPCQRVRFVALTSATMPARTGLGSASQLSTMIAKSASFCAKSGKLSGKTLSASFVSVCRCTGCAFSDRGSIPLGGGFGGHRSGRIAALMSPEADSVVRHVISPDSPAPLEPHGFPGRMPTEEFGYLGNLRGLRHGKEARG